MRMIGRNSSLNEETILVPSRIRTYPWTIFLHRLAQTRPRGRLDWDEADRWRNSYLESLIESRTERTFRIIPLRRKP